MREEPSVFGARAHPQPHLAAAVRFSDLPAPSRLPKKGARERAGRNDRRAELEGGVLLTLSVAVSVAIGEERQAQGDSTPDQPAPRKQRCRARPHPWHGQELRLRSG